MIIVAIILISCKPVKIKSKFVDICITEGDSEVIHFYKDVETSKIVIANKRILIPYRDSIYIHYMNKVTIYSVGDSGVVFNYEQGRRIKTSEYHPKRY